MTHTAARPPGRTAYVQDKCRCADCREACRVYEQARRRKALYGRWQPYVPADEARAHVRSLQAAGMGWKRVARAAGLSPSVLWKLLYGDPTRNMTPSKRIRPQTAAAILAVEPDLAPGAYIDAGPTWRRIEGLVALGYSKRWLAHQLGATGNGLQIHTGQVQVRTAQAVQALADRIGDTPAPPSQASARARNYARARGWLTPTQQWAQEFDDGDEPQPTRPQVLAENARWLIEGGLSIELAASRLGVSPDYLQDVLSGKKGAA
jgi:AraC-like DNA-binding protein